MPFVTRCWRLRLIGLRWAGEGAPILRLASILTPLVVTGLSLIAVTGTSVHAEPAATTDPLVGAPVGGDPGDPSTGGDPTRAAASSEPATEEPGVKEPFAAAGIGAGLVAGEEPVLVEACDGSRQHAAKDARLLACNRWSIAWQERGAAWGLTTADSYEGVLAERERQLGFARHYARFFEVPLDERYVDPSAAICEVCDEEVPAGRWGEGQVFGDAAARQALVAAEAELAALDAALHEHAPRLTDTARLAREPAVSKPARAYAKVLRQGMQTLAKQRLALDDATVLRSERAAKDVSKAAAAQVEALGTALTSLRKAVGKQVAKAHAGRYFEEGAAGPERPYLEVEVDGIEVEATYFVGAAKSVWFQGQVELDGGLAGRSLVAPEQGAPSCAEHSEACGYVYIPSVLRFTEHPTAEGKKVQTAELWFQRSTWAMAKPFRRPGR